jgi:spoIIIJ-associated protein
MNTQRATLEIIAPTVDEAIAKGLTELGLPQDEVDIEILDQGSRGLFGLGSRQVRIRLMVKGASDVQSQALESTALEPTPVEPSFEVEFTPEIVSAQPEISPAMGEEDIVLRTARETVSELLEKMKVKAHVTASYGEPDDTKGRVPVLVDVHGDDLSILIGKRSETLNALQYITSLIVCKELERSVSVIIDIEGYRNRRAGQIRQLAHRMAEQAIKTGRRQTLEPMPANERRIVHIELRDHPNVTTESFGEEPHRKVTIVPKE